MLSNFLDRDGCYYSICLFLDGADAFVVHKAFDPYSYEEIDISDIIAWCDFPYVDEMESCGSDHTANQDPMTWYHPDECLPEKPADCMTLVDAWFDDTMDEPSYVQSMGYMPETNRFTYSLSGLRIGMLPPEHVIAWAYIPMVSDVLDNINDQEAAENKNARP